MTRAAAIIPAAGIGKRMGSAQPKQFLTLQGLPIILHTVGRFVEADCIDQIVVVLPEEWLEQTRLLLSNHFGAAGQRISVTRGGILRQDSVFAGLQQVEDDIDIVLVHDGARPLVTPDLISAVYSSIRKYGAAIAAVPVKDTLKRQRADGIIDHTVDRDGLWQAQTPQGARKELLEQAFSECGDREFTDEAALLEQAGFDVHLAEGQEQNFKITRPEDLGLAKKIMQQDHSLRIGHGYDAHRFVTGRPLVLGGVTIDHDQGLGGHSDADVLTHALCDAILGALGKGDLGHHFPDSDQRFKDIYSINLLREVVQLAADSGLGLVNGDITLICQAPKLAPHIADMKVKLAETCRVNPPQLNIKATTTEKMGFTGRREGIGCHAVVLLGPVLQSAHH